MTLREFAVVGGWVQVLLKGERERGGARVRCRCRRVNLRRRVEHTFQMTRRTANEKVSTFDSPFPNLEAPPEELSS